MNYLVIYHAQCADGTAAAWVVRKYLRQQRNAKITLHAAAYSDAPLTNLAEYAHVYIVDFSYKREVTSAMFAQTPNITILDHHKTAAEELINWKAHPAVIFDMSRSGAVIAWEHFFPEEPVPPILLYVQDRDLWKWELDNSLEVSTALHALDLTPETFGEVVCPSKLPQMVTDGQKLLAYRDTLINAIVSCATPLVVVAAGRQYSVNACGASCLISEVGNALLTEESDFSLSWKRTKDGMAKVSLRGHDRVDCSAIAKIVGGGGHFNAAGFTVPWGPFAIGLASGVVVIS